MLLTALGEARVFDPPPPAFIEEKITVVAEARPAFAEALGRLQETLAPPGDTPPP